MAFVDPIMPGDLIMRAVLNRQTKLHFKWDGPFVNLDSTAKDTYQLATANGYTLPNLSNIAHLQKLDTKKRAKYNGDFREASRRLKLCDQTAKKQKGTNDINKRPTEPKIQPQCRDHFEPRAASPRDSSNSCDRRHPTI